jgi:hypothetical protein
MCLVFGRGIDRALRASEQRYEEFSRELEERRRRLDRELLERSERFESESQVRYRDQLQITREVIRRNELVMSKLVEKIESLTEESKAQTRAIFQVLDRLENGGGAAAS